MNSAVIQVEGLGKRYRRGMASHAESLYEAATRIVRTPLQALRRDRQEEFWALRDVSLEVREGQVLGLIGRNGAGKTTLLKILSRITQPSTGWAEIRGRVRSLLEVGTGFHAELTGRENTYLSGSILGMSKREIDSKFDEIVAFAEIDKFIDTPVKRYSSGMYVRLAFAVAAHLEPEILLVDEVLAVGDINFQKKCLGKMGDVARQGRTVVLVSHQMNALRQLCQQVAWIDNGTVRQVGPAHKLVSLYETAMASGRQSVRQSLNSGQKARFIRWNIVSSNSDDPNVLNVVGAVTIEFVTEIYDRIRIGRHGIALYNHDRQLVWGWASPNLELEPGEHRLSYSFPMLPLRPGAYHWLVSLYDDREEVDAWECLPELIVATENYQHASDQWSGLLNIPVEFSIVSGLKTR